MASLAERTATYFETLARLTREAGVSDRAGRPITIAAGIEDFLQRGHAAHQAGNKLIFIGNGASASMASHYALDFSKNGGIRALALNDGAMLTALANDIGPEALFADQVGYYAQEGDVLVAISSSGSSPNILAAVDKAREKNCTVITFSGFDADNPLRLSGDLNFHVAGDEYGFVEIAHSALIHAILDLSLGWGTADDRNPGALKRRRMAAE
ncbi:SIS domain-containing protein [Nisaea acidiphila]|uniref:SIS domain-containing protein n=1 Tax=Nisaea acidiphila TaxID=1862145 RepID=A0A9J7ASL1_9PROT|nr:SIS domain-containing protein [Nisaea acidiphila]UUX48333.1 SIS domain-containing protein [Nisaea acidiphila]